MATTGSITLTDIFDGAAGANGTNGTDGTNGADGIDGIDGAAGADGFAVAQLTSYIRAASLPATPTGGSYNFGTNTLVSPTSWSNGIPAGTDPVYQTQSNVQSDAGGTGTKTPTWGAPARLVEDGADGVIGSDGTDGVSVYTTNVYLRKATVPTEPITGDGEFNFTTNVLTAPSTVGGSADNWFTTVPAGTDPLYSSTATFSITGQTGTDSNPDWSAPIILVRDGTDGVIGSDGNDGLSTYLYNTYLRSASAPATPTGGSYNFTTNVGTPPAGWVNSVPAGTDPLYTTSALASVSGPTGTDSTLTWVAPVILSQDGTDGAPGAPGDPGAPGADGADGSRGPGRFDAEIATTVQAVGSPQFNADARSVVCTALGGTWTTSCSIALGDPIAGDTVVITYADGTGAAIHDGAGVLDNNWTSFAIKIDGSLLVDGTVTGTAIQSTTTITAGNGTDVAVLNGSHADYRIYAGDSNPVNAPFKVTKAGKVIISSDTSTSNSRLVIDDDQLKVYEGTQLKVLIGRLI